MARVDDLLDAALKSLPAKPAATAGQNAKRRYSELVSQVVALALAEELRARGLDGARPAPPGLIGGSGAERRMAGGLGAKKVDVTWATEEAGLLLAISVKSINFPQYQKNLTNRRGDMLMEAVTLHRRFPYAVIGAMFFFDSGAARDSSPRRSSTIDNAHRRLKLFTNRNDPAGRDEQFERFYILLLDASPTAVSIQAYHVGDAVTVIPMTTVIDELLSIVADRNPDFYEYKSGKLKKVR